MQCTIGGSTHGVVVEEKSSVTEARQAEARLKEILRAGRGVEADLLVELGRFERRKMHETLGCRNFWDFLTRRLGFLECAAFNRMHASRLVGRCPEALARLRDGRLCVTSLVLLRHVLEGRDPAAVFDRVIGKTRKQIVDLVALLSAEDTTTDENAPPPRPFKVRKAPSPNPVVASKEDVALRESGQPPNPVAPNARSPEPASAPEPPAQPRPASSDPVVVVLRPRERRTELHPVGEDLYDLSMRVGRRFVELLEEARITEGHAVQGGDPEAILVRGLELLIERAGKKTGKIPVKERKSSTKHSPREDSKYVSAALLREVMVRDDHKCQWEIEGGGLCASRERLEPDHILSRARGGKTVIENLRVLCHEHNALAAREQLGEDFVAERIRVAQAARAARGAAQPASPKDAAPKISEFPPGRTTLF